MLNVKLFMYNKNCSQRSSITTSSGPLMTNHASSLWQVSVVELVSWNGNRTQVYSYRIDS